MREKIGAITMMLDGSKRFPGKATAPFLGIPLYMHTVNFALMLGVPYYVMTNIKGLTFPSGVTVKGRGAHPENISEEILSLGLDWDIYILLQVTSPLRDIESVRKSIWDFRVSHKKCLISVHHFAHKYFYGCDGLPVNFLQSSRTYDGCPREAICHETGSLFLFRKEQLNKKHILSVDDPSEMAWVEDRYNIDIDYKEDIEDIERRLA